MGTILNGAYMLTLWKITWGIHLLQVPKVARNMISGSRFNNTVSIYNALVITRKLDIIVISL